MRKITFTLFLVLAFLLKVSVIMAQSDPIAKYTFNDGPEDVTGNGYDGTLTGDAYVEEGFLVLDGEDGAVLLPEIGIYNEATYAMWVYPTVDLESVEFAGGINTNSWPENGIHFKINYGLLNVAINNFGPDLKGTTVIPTNEWSHIALTISESDVNLYLNGVNEATQSLDQIWDLIIGTSHIGAWDNNGTIEREITGKMEEVLIFDVALSEEEIVDLADWDSRTGVVSYNIPETSELTLYPNPVNDVLYIENASAVENVEIYDIVGNLVFNVKNNDALLLINVNSLKSGIYMIRAYTSEGIGISSFIKQ